MKQEQFNPTEFLKKLFTDDGVTPTNVSYSGAGGEHIIDIPREQLMDSTAAEDHVVAKLMGVGINITASRARAFKAEYKVWVKLDLKKLDELTTQYQVMTSSLLPTETPTQTLLEKAFDAERLKTTHLLDGILDDLETLNQKIKDPELSGLQYTHLQVFHALVMVLARASGAGMFSPHHNLRLDRVYSWVHGKTFNQMLRNLEALRKQSK